MTTISPESEALSAPFQKIFEPTLLTTIFPLFFVLAVYIFNKIKPSYVPTSVPGPERHPLYGILRCMKQNREIWPTKCWEYSEKFKRTWGGPLPNFGRLNGSYFFVVGEENLRHILSVNFENYVKGDAWHKRFHELLGDGIFSVNGERWLTHRKITSNMFSRNLMRNAAHVTMSKIEKIIEIFEDKLKKENELLIDIQDFFFRLTFDSTALVVFGVDIKSLEESQQHPFATAFDEMQKLLMMRTNDPLFELKRDLQLTKRERRIRKLKTILDAFALDVINTKRRTIETCKELGPDLISRFLDHAKKHNETITNGELRDIITNIMIAGRDTTASALTWAFYELSRHPEVVQKIRDEVSSKFGNDKNYSFTYDSVGKLSYTHAVAMEVLRLHPSVPNDRKFAVKDDVLPDGTHILAKAAVSYGPYAMGRSKEFWGDDALEFKPERFVGAREPSPFIYTAFNAGPRMCLGKPLALSTIKMGIAALFTKFDFCDSLGHTDEYDWSLVQTMKHGFVVNITKRDK